MAKKSKAEKTEKTKQTETNKETEVKKSKSKKGAEAVEATPLQSLAAEINKVLGVEPALDASAKDLEAQIKEIMPEIQPEDKLSKESFAVLKELGWGGKQKKVKKEAKQLKEAKEGKKEKRETALSLACRLTKEKASDKEIQKAFVAFYKDKGKDDADFISKRIATYMSLAKKG